MSTLKPVKSLLALSSTWSWMARLRLQVRERMTTVLQAEVMLTVGTGGRP